MILRPQRGKLPVELPVSLSDFDVVNAGVTMRHQPVTVEFPVFIAVGAIPLTLGRLELIAVTGCDAVIGEGPKFFDKSIVQFFRPLIFQKFDDLVASLQEGIAVAPDAVWSIR